MVADMEADMVVDMMADMEVDMAADLEVIPVSRFHLTNLSLEPFSRAQFGRVSCVQILKPTELRLQFIQNNLSIHPAKKVHLLR